MGNQIITDFIFGGNAEGLKRTVSAVQNSLNQLKGAGSGLNTTTTSSNALTSALVGTAAKFFGITSAILLARKAMHEFVGEVSDAIKLSADFERIRTGFVSVLSGPVLATKPKGEGLTPEDFKQLNLEARVLFQESQIAGIKTIATTQEYVSLLKTTLAVGQQQGFTQEETRKVTLRLVQAAQAFGISMDEVSTSAAQILAGVVRTTNPLARNLGLTTATGRAQLKAALAAGEGYAFLIKRTEQFAQAADQASDSFVNVAAAVTDIKELVSVAAIVPLFKLLSETLINIRDTFVGQSGFKPAALELIGTLQRFVASVLPGVKLLIGSILADAQRLLAAFTSEKTSQSLNGLLFLLSGLLNILTAAVLIAEKLQGVLGFDLLGQLLGLAGFEDRIKTFDAAWKASSDFRKKLAQEESDFQSHLDSQLQKGRLTADDDQLRALEERKTAYIEIQRLAEKIKADSTRIDITESTQVRPEDIALLNKLSAQAGVRGDVTSAEGLASIAQQASEGADAVGKLLEKQVLLAKSSEDLLVIVRDENAEDSTRAAAKSALAAVLENEARLNHQTASSYIAKGIAAKTAALAQIQASKDVLVALDAEADAQVKSLILASIPALPGASSDAVKAAAIANLKSDIAAFTSAAAAISRTISPAKAKGSKGKGQRDELRDFVSELERQLGVLKRVNDLINKEAERLLQTRVKIIRALSDAGVIPFESAQDIEKGLIVRAFNLDAAISQARQELIDADIALTKIVADRQKARDQKKDKTGTDSRSRDIEAAEKLYGDKLDQYVKRVDDLKKVEDQLFEIGSRAGARRIELRETELRLDDELFADATKLESELAGLAEQFGFASVADAAAKSFAARRTELEARRKEIIRAIFPQDDPAIFAEIQEATKKIKALTDSELDAATFTKLESAVARVKELQDAYTKLNTQRANAPKSQANVSQIDAQLRAISEELVTVSGGLKLSVDDAIALGDAFAVLERTGVSAVKKLEGIAALRKIDNEVTLENVKQAAEVLKQAQTRLDLEGKFVDFNIQRLDLLDQIAAKERELGITTDAQLRSQSAALIQQRIALLEAKKAIAEHQLAQVSGQINALGGPAANPALAQQQIELQGALNQIAVQFFELKSRVFDLTSPIVALSAAFKDVGDAVGNLPGDLAKLKGIFTGLQTLADTIAGKLRPKPEELLSQAGNTFQKSVVSFDAAVLKFAAAIGISGSTSSTGSVGGKRGISPFGIDLDSLASTKTGDIGKAQADVENTIKTKIASVIVAAGQTVAGVLNAIANKDLGAGIASFAPLANLIPVAGPFISAGLQIVGSLVSFFTASAKRHTQELAATLSKGVEELREKISSGAVALGQGIRELDLKLQEARRALSGKKGGAEELAKLEATIADEKKQLREEALKIQQDFRANLEILRQPTNLRDTIRAINDVEAAAKKFLESFEARSDAVKAIDEVTQFIRLSLKELSDDIKKSLAASLKELGDLTDSFEADQRSILLSGRIDPAVSEAESKRRRLVELEKTFQNRKAEIEDQINAEKLKLDYVNSRADIETKIAKLVEGSASSLGASADKLLNASLALERAFSAASRFPFGIGPGSAIGAQSGGLLGRIDLTFNGQAAGTLDVGVNASRHIEIAGLIPRTGRGTRFNPI